MIKTLRNRFSACILAAVTVLAAIPAVPVHAESGTVYSCTINRSYSNPVTGEIEDAGGEASYTTGQGMVEGCVYGSGMLEVTDSGNYYLTVRLGLIDYTSNQSFTVQNVGIPDGRVLPRRLRRPVLTATERRRICVCRFRVKTVSCAEACMCLRWAGMLSLFLPEQLFRGEQCGDDTCICDRSERRHADV